MASIYHIWSLCRLTITVDWIVCGRISLKKNMNNLKLWRMLTGFCWKMYFQHTLLHISLEKNEMRCVESLTYVKDSKLDFCNIYYT